MSNYFIYFSIFEAKRNIPRGSSIYYLGYSQKNKRYLVNHGYKLLQCSEDLDKIVEKIKFKYIDFVTEIGELQKDKLKWWSTRIASKNNLDNNIFEILCKVILIKELIRNNRVKYFVIDDIKAGLTLMKNHSKISSFSKFYLYQKYFLSVNWLIVKTFLNRVRYLFNMILYRIAVNGLYAKAQENSLLIYSWLEERSFDQQNEYKDPYLPGLCEISEVKPYILCSYYSSPKLIRKIVDKYEVLCLSQFSNIYIEMKAIFSFFTKIIEKEFYELNLKPLFNYEIIIENSTSVFIKNIHNFYCWKKMFEIVKKGKIIYPFENQSWEKIMLVAKNISSSEIEAIGYQHSVIGMNHISFHTTDRELKFMPIPEKLITNSIHTEKLYKNYFNNKADVINGGALRYSTYSDIFVSKNNGVKKIGIAFPLHKYLAYDLFEELDQYNNEYGYEILLRFHPDLILMNNINKSYIKISRGTISEFFSSIDALIYCSSSVGLEAFVLGIDVYKYQGDYIDLKIGEDFFSPKVITSLNNFKLNENHSRKSKKYFSDVNLHVWKQSLNIYLKG